MKTRILFVDDDREVLNGLRRVLRKHRNQWDMFFANGFGEALGLMAEATFDAVVTDSKMSGMSGVALLERIRDEYPRTARIILSGYANEEESARISKVAHQFIYKPVDSDALTDAVARACSLCDAYGNEQIQACVVDVSAIPSLPQLYMEISRAAASEDCSLREITRIIERDMAMTAKLLQLVNSAFFGLGQRISSPEKAVSLLGINRIKAIVLVDQVFSQFSIKGGEHGFTADSLWRHSLQVAHLARAISKHEKQNGDRPDQAYTAGLLHDIGILILASQHREAFSKVIGADNPMGIDNDPVHAVAGAHLLSLWGLPSRIVEAVALHHTPNSIAFDGLCALSAVHVADALLSDLYRTNNNEEMEVFNGSLDEQYMERIACLSKIPAWRALAEKVYDDTEVVCC